MGEHIDLPAELRTLARARGYRLLSELLLHGAASCGADEIATIDPEAVDSDELDTQYVAAFDLGVPPYASTFLERDGMVGGAVTRAAADAMQRDGELPVTDEVGACHLGVLLGHAARLCATGRDRDAARFVARHVLPWLPAHLFALESLPVPFWTRVVRVALDVAVAHVGEAPQPVASVGTDEDDPLRDPGAGLREVAAYLAAAARCGVFLTDAECSRIGRTLDLPRGFGPRRARIETLLRSAAEYDGLVPLCDALDAVLMHRRARLHQLAEEWADAAALQRWTDRIDATRCMVATLRAGAQSVAAERETVP